MIDLGITVQEEKYWRHQKALYTKDSWNRDPHGLSYLVFIMDHDFDEAAFKSPRHASQRYFTTWSTADTSPKLSGNSRDITYPGRPFSEGIQLPPLYGYLLGGLSVYDLYKATSAAS